MWISWLKVIFFNQEFTKQMFINLILYLYNTCASCNKFPNFFTAIRLGQHFLKTDSFKFVGVDFAKRHHPFCEEHDLDTDDYWRCYVIHNTFTMYHPVGTCKMGAANDHTAVVDPNLRLELNMFLFFCVVRTSIWPLIDPYEFLTSIRTSGLQFVLREATQFCLPVIANQTL